MADARSHRSPTELPAERDEIAAALRAALEQARREELARGLSVVGPHRDDLVLQLGRDAGQGLRLTWRVMVVCVGASARVL